MAKKKKKDKNETSVLIAYVTVMSKSICRRS